MKSPTNQPRSIKTNKKPNKLYFGIPSGSLQKPVMRLLRSADLIPAEDWERQYEVEYNEIIWRIRDRVEMAAQVMNGVVDAGITGKDYIAETGYTDKVQALADYIFSRTSNKPSRLVLAAMKSAFPNPDNAIGKLIATEFPNLTRQQIKAVLGWKDENINIVPSIGKTETKVSDGEADLCTDITETGNTLRANGMEEVVTLFESNPQLIANPETLKDAGMRRDLEDIGTSISAALENENDPKALIEMNVPKIVLEQICSYLVENNYTRKAPTVLQTNDSVWSAIRTVVSEKESKQLERELRKQFKIDDIIINKIDYFIGENNRLSIPEPISNRTSKK